MSYITLIDQGNEVVPVPTGTKKKFFGKTNGLYYKDSSGLEEKLIDDHDVAHVESIMNLSIQYAGGF